MLNSLVMLSPFDSAQGWHGLVELGTDHSTPPSFAQDDTVRGRAFAKSEFMVGRRISFVSLEISHEVC